MADDDDTRKLPPEEPEGKPGGGGPGEPAPQTPEGEPTHELPPAAEEPTREQPSPAAAPGPRRLKRSRDDRLIAGVCGGLGRYFGIDPVIFRVGAVALVFLGGAGALLYLAAILLVPDEDSDQQSGRSLSQRGLAIAGVVLLVIAAGAIFSHGPFHFWPAWPLGFLFLFGLAIWWLATAERPSRGTNGGDTPRKTGQRLMLGLLVLAGSAVFAIGGAWLAGAGSVTAAGIAVLSAALMVGLGAFAGFGRWLILPALAFAIPVGVVSAAGIDLHGGAGNREYNPASSAQLRPSYKVGAGRLMVDVRNANLTPGDHFLKLRVGLGQAVLVVPDNVCVAAKAHAGVGNVETFGESHGGVDVDYDDQPPALNANPRIVLDANVGMGEVLITHNRDDAFDHRGFRDFKDHRAGLQANIGCEVK